jgi:hypothetical protein
MGALLGKSLLPKRWKLTRPFIHGILDPVIGQEANIFEFYLAPLVVSGKFYVNVRRGVEPIPIPSI